MFWIHRFPSLAGKNQLRVLSSDFSCYNSAENEHGYAEQLSHAPLLRSCRTTIRLTPDKRDSRNVGLPRFGIMPTILGQSVLRQSSCRTIRFRKLRITPPQNAGQNPRPSKPGTNTAANFSIRALITSQKIPKVRTDSGNVSSFKRAPK